MNAVATQKQPTTIAELLEVNRSLLLQALPKQIKADRFLRICLNSIARNPDLQKCSATSLYGAIMQCAQFGLEPGMMNQAHIVPYWNSDKRCFEAQFQIGYLGMRDMAERNGDVLDGDAQAVHEKDSFDYGLGDSPFITHKPSKDQDRGDIVHFYCWAQSAKGKLKVSVMSTAEVKEHREKFAKKKKDGSFGPAWTVTFEAMAIKTVIRRCYKLLARSPELREAIALDEMQQVSIPQNLGMEVEIEQRDAARLQNAEALKALQETNNTPESSTESAQPGDPHHQPEQVPPSDAAPAPSLPASNICQQLRLCESIAEAASIMNDSMQWPYSAEEREQINKVFAETKKRLGKR